MSVTGQASAAGRRAARSKTLKMAARAGFVARGVNYVLIGFIALRIALGHGGQADRGGALAQIAANPLGVFVLWLLVVGFAGLALWRLSEAAFGATGPHGHDTSERLKSLGRAVLYAFFFWTTFQFVTGSSSGATANGNGQSRVLTADLMSQPGGQWLVGVVGLVVLIIGFVLAREGWNKKFLQRMNFAGAPAGTRSMVEKLGVFGGVARGLVFAVTGGFLIMAAVNYSPSEAQGLDGTLRVFAHTPAGPALLALVALGLISFGLFSWCEARWRRL